MHDKLHDLIKAKEAAFLPKYIKTLRQTCNELSKHYITPLLSVLIDPITLKLQQIENFELLQAEEIMDSRNKFSHLMFSHENQNFTLFNINSANSITPKQHKMATTKLMSKIRFFRQFRQKLTKEMAKLRLTSVIAAIYDLNCKQIASASSQSSSNRLVPDPNLPILIRQLMKAPPV